MSDPGDYRYECPTASVFEDLAQYVPLLLSAIDAELGRSSVWPDECAAAALGYVEDLRVYISELIDQRKRMIGAIVAGLHETRPADWLPCNGTQYNAADYPELWAVLPSSLKSEVTQKFTTPNLVNRFIYGSSHNDQLTPGGVETVTLTQNEIPAHSHATAISGQNFVTYTATGNNFKPAAGAGPFNLIPGGGANTATTGGGLPHENMPPYLTMQYFIIAR